MRTETGGAETTDIDAEDIKGITGSERQGSIPAGKALSFA
jgi:hypothetical protein